MSFWGYAIKSLNFHLLVLFFAKTENLFSPDDKGREKDWNKSNWERLEQIKLDKFEQKQIKKLEKNNFN